MLVVAAVTFLLTGASSSFAQPVPADTSQIPAPAAASPGEPVRVGRGPTAQIPVSGAPIRLEAGKGTLIRLARPASTVFIANPDVADVQVKSPSLIYLNAKAPGETVLYAADADDHILLNAPVRVVHDLSRLRGTARAFIPGQGVSIDSVDNAIVLSGTVPTAAQAERLQTNAVAIASETKGTVVNRLSIATPNQVMLRVKVAEVNRTVLKVLGFNINKAFINPATGVLLRSGRSRITPFQPVQTARFSTEMNSVLE